MTRQQLLDLGMHRESINYRRRIGRLYRSYSGVYSVGCPPITPQEHAMAAVLACGDRAVLSHGSALALWGIWKRWPRPSEVTTTADRRPKGIRVHRVRRLDRADVTRHQGIPVTTLARTLLDQAEGMAPRSLTRAVNDGRLNGHLQLADLADVVKRYPNHPGRRKLEAVLGLSGERPTRSRFEDKFLAFCKRYGLPEPRINAVVCGYEVDAFFEEEKVIVELDSWTFHSSRTSFEGDREKDAVTAAAGLLTVRITWQRFEQRPDQEAALLHAILAQRRERAA